MPMKANQKAMVTHVVSNATKIWICPLSTTLRCGLGIAGESFLLLFVGNSSIQKTPRCLRLSPVSRSGIINKKGESPFPTDIIRRRSRVSDEVVVLPRVKLVAELPGRK